MNYIYFPSYTLSGFDLLIKKYINTQILINKDIEGIIVPKDNKQHLLVKSQKEWIKGEQEDYVDLATQIKEKIIKINNINQYVGFIGDFKNEFNIIKKEIITDPTYIKYFASNCDNCKSNAIAVEVKNNIMPNFKSF